MSLQNISINLYKDNNQYESNEKQILYSTDYGTYCNIIKGNDIFKLYQMYGGKHKAKKHSLFEQKLYNKDILKIRKIWIFLEYHWVLYNTLQIWKIYK